MAVSEFELIKKYFNRPGLIPDTMQSAQLPVGIGDDCALLDLPAEKLLAVSMDTLLADVHFPAQTDPSLIAQRAMAVNLSDLAAMGATPLACTLALSLPKAEDDWLQAFSLGLETMVQNYACPLIGGDISKGPLGITIQVHGLIEKGAQLSRSGARPGDLVYVSGVLGAAGLAVSLLSNGMSLNKPDTIELYNAYYKPQPRLALGQSIAGTASAAIDISDGLVADLGHVARQSEVGIELIASKIPIATTVKKFMGSMEDKQKGLSLALTAGDEYELAITVAEDNQKAFLEQASQTDIAITLIGRVVKGSRVRCLDSEGKEIEVAKAGYQHF